jgi:hypothetical protein
MAAIKPNVASQLTVPINSAVCERSDCVVGVQNPITVVGQCVDFRLHFFDLFFVSVLLSCSSPHMQLSQLVTHLEQ